MRAARCHGDHRHPCLSCRASLPGSGGCGGRKEGRVFRQKMERARSGPRQRPMSKIPAAAATAVGQGCPARQARMPVFPGVDRHRSRPGRGSSLFLTQRRSSPVPDPGVDRHRSRPRRGSSPILTPAQIVAGRKSFGLRRPRTAPPLPLRAPWPRGGCKLRGKAGAARPGRRRRHRTSPAAARSPAARGRSARGFF